MIHKRLLTSYCNILFFSCFISTFMAQSDQKIMHFIPVKKATEKKNIIPFNKDFFNEIQQLFNIDILVETGTYLGDTCAIAATVFKQVHTIELSEELFRHVCKRFFQTPQVFPYQGDSGIVLQQVLSTIEPGSRIAILLDSHWSGGNTAKGADVPILRELDSIKKSGLKNSIILIDDVRCFQKQPAQSPDPYQYPELSHIIACIHEINPQYTCVVYSDVLIAYTDHNILVPAIVQAMTISRLNQGTNETLSKAEALIAAASNEDFSYLAQLANDFDISTGYWRTHYYDFWYALALYNHGHTASAYQYMRQAAHLGFHRAQYYLKIWEEDLKKFIFINRNA